MTSQASSHSICLITLAHDMEWLFVIHYTGLGSQWLTTEALRCGTRHGDSFNAILFSDIVSSMHIAFFIVATP